MLFRQGWGLYDRQGQVIAIDGKHFVDYSRGIYGRADGDVYQAYQSGSYTLDVDYPKIREIDKFRIEAIRAVGKDSGQFRKDATHLLVVQDEDALIHLYGDDFKHLESLVLPNESIIKRFHLF